MLVLRMPRVPRERTTVQERVIAAIETLDLTAIQRKLTNRTAGLGWSEVETSEAIRWYRRFLILRVLYPERQIAPSHAVDVVWRAHMLNTSQYAADCDCIFGAFLHHELNPKRGEGFSRAMLEGFAEAQVLSKLEFGVASPAIGG